VTEDDARQWRAALVITLAATLVRLAFAALLPLFPDETYYWDWSRHLASGYFDHPPAIAHLIYAGTSLAALVGAGPSPFVIRLFPVIAGSTAGLFTALIARRLGGGAAARSAAVVFALMPLAASGLVIATPDAPLLAASAGGLYFVVRALQSAPGSRASTGHWITAGIFLGLAFTSKYTSILLPVTLTAAVLARPSLRVRLREPGPYLACIVATLVFLPVLHWNWTHDWISFRFQIQHGLGTPKGSAIKRELDLIGGQLGLVSPILFVLAASAVWRTIRHRADDARFALAVVATGSWIFFAYSAIRRPVEANWPAPSYVPAIALLAALLPASDRWLRRGIALAGVLVAIIYVHALHPILPLPARRDPVARSAGWDALAARVQEARVALGPRTFVGADRYQEVSELAYQLPDRPHAFCMCITGRHNQYELWSTFPSVAKLDDNLVLVLDETPGTPNTAERLTPYFARVSRGALAPLLRGNDTVSVRRVWVLQGYRGGWWAVRPTRATAPDSLRQTVPRARGDEPQAIISASIGSRAPTAHDLGAPHASFGLERKARDDCLFARCLVAGYAAVAVGESHANAMTAGRRKLRYPSQCSGQPRRIVVRGVRGEELSQRSVECLVDAISQHRHRSQVNAQKGVVCRSVGGAARRRRVAPQLDHRARACEQIKRAEPHAVNHGPDAMSGEFHGRLPLRGSRR